MCNIDIYKAHADNKCCSLLPMGVRELRSICNVFNERYSWTEKTLAILAYMHWKKHAPVMVSLWAKSPQVLWFQTHQWGIMILQQKKLDANSRSKPWKSFDCWSIEPLLNSTMIILLSSRSLLKFDMCSTNKSKSWETPEESRTHLCLMIQLLPAPGSQPESLGAKPGLLGWTRHPEYLFPEIWCLYILVACESFLPPQRMYRECSSLSSRPTLVPKSYQKAMGSGCSSWGATPWRPRSCRNIERG